MTSATLCDATSISNSIIMELAKTKSWHRTLLSSALDEFANRLQEKTSFSGYHIQEILPESNLIILATGQIGKFARRMYGLSAFEVYLDGEINERLSKLWRFILRDYLGCSYAIRLERYAISKGSEGDFFDEIHFFLFNYDKDPNQKVYLPG